MLTLTQILAALKDRNLAKVAQVLGCSRSALSGYMRGKFNPSEEMLKKLSDYIEGGKK